MALSIYKPGQGYWTRMLSAIGYGTIVLSGAGWMFTMASRDLFGLGQSLPIIYQQSLMAVFVLLVFSVLGFWLMNKVTVVDFMIATEAEMKKVNWPSRREIIGSTYVVIGGTLLLALLLWIIDMFFWWFFHQINILYSA